MKILAKKYLLHRKLDYICHKIIKAGEKVDLDVTRESYEIPIMPWARIRGIRVGRIRGRGARIRRRRRRRIIGSSMAGYSRRTGI